MKSFLTNWKTTSSGLLMIVMGLCSLVGIKYGPGMTPEAAITAIMGGFGLLFAKDGNVTGGTTPQ